MKQRDKEILSVMLDDQAGARDIQRILGQAHDEEIRQYWWALNQQRDAQDEAVSAWAGIDLGGQIAAALDGPDATQTTAVGAGGAVLALEGGAEPRRGTAEEQPRIAAPEQRKVAPWMSLAIAASVMFLTVLVLDNRVAERSPGAAVESATRSVTTESAPIAVAQAPGNALADDETVYEERLQALLMRHAEKAAVGAGSGVVPLARLTSFQASRE